MEISDQLFEEVSAALAIADDTLGTTLDWCKSVKDAFGVDIQKICEKIENTKVITNAALKKVKHNNG